MRVIGSYATLLTILILSSLLAGCSGSSNSFEKDLEGGWLVYEYENFDEDGEHYSDHSEIRYEFGYVLFELGGSVGTASWDGEERCEEKYGDDGKWVESESLCFPPYLRWDSCKVLDEGRMTWTASYVSQYTNENDCMNYGNYNGSEYSMTSSWQNGAQTCSETMVREYLFFVEGNVLIFQRGDIDAGAMDCVEIVEEGYFQIAMRDITEGPDSNWQNEAEIERIDAAIEDLC